MLHIICTLLTQPSNIEAILIIDVLKIWDNIRLGKEYRIRLCHMTCHATCHLVVRCQASLYYLRKIQEEISSQELFKTWKICYLFQAKSKFFSMQDRRFTWPNFLTMPQLIESLHLPRSYRLYAFRFIHVLLDRIREGVLMNFLGFFGVVCYDIERT